MIDHPQKPPRLWLSALLFSATFYACAEVGRMLSVPAFPYVSFWLPAGLSVGVLLLHDPRAWPWFMLAAAPANFLFDYRSGTPFGTTLGFYGANMLEAVTGAWLVRRWVAPKPSLATLKELLGLLGFAAILASMLGASVGAATLTASGMSQSFWRSWFTWWGNEAMAISLLTPGILVWFSKPPSQETLCKQRGKFLEATLLTVAIVGLAGYMLAVDQGINAPCKSQLLLLLLWAGLRFGMRGATAANLLLAVLIGFFTTHFLKGLTPAEIVSGSYVATMQSFIMVFVLLVLIPTIILREHRRAEVALRQGKQLLREQYAELENFYRTTPVGLCMVDPDLRYVRINERLAAINGQPVEAHLDRTMQEMAPGIAPQLVPLCRRVVETGEPVIDQEVSGATAATAGAMRSWLVSYHPIKDLDGGICGVCGAVINITERKQAEEAQRKSEAEFRVTFENAAIGMALVDLDGHPLQSNRALQQLLGYSNDELRDMDFTQFTHPEDVRADLELFRELIEGQRERYQIEKRYLRKSGGLVYTRLTVSAVRSLAGTAEFAIGMVEDITDRRRLEDQLRQAQKMEALGTLAGGTAHEFNNMLGIIIGFSELSKSELEAQHPVQSNLDEVMQASQRAREIVQQVLTFSRQQRQERKFIQLHDVALEAIKHVRKLVPNSVEIKSDISLDGFAIMGNATQIHQVITNICINAWHALPEGLGAIRLIQKSVTLDKEASVIHPSLAEGTYLRLSISDNGKGMDSATLARIFEPFFTTKAPGQGSGLGLAVVHGIMQSHDGAVVAHSEPGRGTTFDLYFPARPDVGSAAPAPPTNPVCLGSGQRILVVDDEPSLTSVAVKFLKRLGYRATATHSVSEALEIFQLQGGATDLVITDLTMPDRSGIDLAMALHEARPSLPVILATGFDGAATAETGRPPNIRALLQKPYTFDILAQTINLVLTGQAEGRRRSALDLSESIGGQMATPNADSPLRMIAPGIAKQSLVAPIDAAKSGFSGSDSVPLRLNLERCEDLKT